MTVVRPNSISGITSITAQTDTINFFKSDGSLAGLLLNGTNFNTTSGVSTFNVLKVGTATTLDSSGINVSGVGTVASLIATNLNVSGVGTFLSSGLKIRNPANTFEYTIAGSAIVANRNVTLPLAGADITLASTDISSQTFLGTNTFSGSVSFGGANVTINPSSANGNFTLGNTAGTGNIILGQSTASQTTNIQAGASGVGTTKTINLGTGGLSGSFTQINIGPSAGVGTVVINSGTNLGIGSTTPTSKLEIQGDVRVVGVITATSDVKIGTKSVATTGKAIAMAMVFS